MPELSHEVKSFNYGAIMYLFDRGADNTNIPDKREGAKLTMLALAEKQLLYHTQRREATIKISE